MRAPGVAAMVVALLMLLPSPAIPRPHQTRAPKKPPQVKLAEPFPEAAKLAARRKDAEARPLFQEEKPLAVTLQADFKAVNRDRSPGSTKAFPGVLAVTGEDGAVPAVALQVQLRARGNVRRQSGTCASVPLTIAFVKQDAKRTVFDGQNKLKLVRNCNEGQRFDQLVLLEYLAYRLYNLMTPLSFRVRLAHITYVDSKSGRTLSTHDAVFIEDDDDVAARAEGRSVEMPGLLFKDFDQEPLTLMTVFQYMIGNPDYSITGMHNVRLVQTAANVLLPITWDFDVTGLVDPRYAVPNASLRTAIAGVGVRSYLGPCRSEAELEPTLAAFREKQTAMQALVDAIPGLDDTERRRAAEYLKEFFTLIGSKESVKRELIDTCHDRPTT
jgi:hypothetical protein